MRLSRWECRGSPCRDRHRSIATSAAARSFKRPFLLNGPPCPRRARSRSFRRTDTDNSTDRPFSPTASSSASRRPPRAICRKRRTRGCRPSRRTIPSFASAGTQQATRVSQRSAIATPLVNPSPLGGQERLVVWTTFLADGSLFYYLTVVPENDAAAFQETFRRIGESIRLTEVR